MNYRAVTGSAMPIVAIHIPSLLSWHNRRYKSLIFVFWRCYIINMGTKLMKKVSNEELRFRVFANMTIYMYSHLYCFLRLNCVNDLDCSMFSHSLFLLLTRRFTLAFCVVWKSNIYLNFTLIKYQKCTDSNWNFECEMKFILKYIFNIVD